MKKWDLLSFLFLHWINKIKTMSLTIGNKEIITGTFLAIIPWIATAEKPKNVLLIAIDDLRPTIGCYGDPFAITPHIDRFAEKSFLYNHAYCQQAVSGPSRASLLTGLRPDQIGVTDLNTHFRKKCPDVITLPQFYKEKGYTSLGIGKIFHGSVHTQDSLSWSAAPIYNLSIKKEEYVLKENRHGGKAAAIEIADLPEDCFIDGKVTGESLKLLKQFSQTKEPFFLAVGFIKPHLPFSMPEKYRNLYADILFPIPDTISEKGNIPSMAFHNWEELRGYTDIPDSGELSGTQKQELLAAYYACVSFIDAQIGMLLEELEASGLDQNTIVVIWGDNGFHLGEQNLWGKATNFEVACKVPFLIYDPGHEQLSRTIDSMVELTDIYPTLLDLCGFETSYPLAGESLVSLMFENKTEKNKAFSQFPRPYRAINSSDHQTHMGYSIRMKDWRYTLWYDVKTNTVTDKELYYRPTSSNYELENLSGLKRYADIENELSQYISNYKNNK